MAWLIQTAARAVRGLGRFLIVFVPIVIIFGAARVATGGAEFDGMSPSESLLVLVSGLTALYLGAFVFAASIPPDENPTRARYLTAWTAAGALALPSFFGAAYLADILMGTDGDPQGLMDGPWFWLMLLVGGAFTGFMYGYHAVLWRGDG